MEFKVGPTGKLIQGHIFDVNRDSFKRALNRVSPDLYLTWNSRKRRGLGCWEIRCRPLKTWEHMATYKGAEIYSLEMVENDILHHVKDVPFLTYEALNIVDLRDKKDWVRNYEYKEREKLEATKAKLKAERAYALKQDRKIFKDFKEMVNSGVNPALLGKYWGTKG